MESSIVWFRRDLRITDNPAIAAANTEGKKVIAVYLHSPNRQLDLNEGSASSWWLYYALKDLENQIHRLGGQLLLIQTDTPVKTLSDLAQEYNTKDIRWNRRYEPKAVTLDTQIKSSLQEQGLQVSTYIGDLINEPHAIRNKSGTPFKVFTPFWNHCRTLPTHAPVDISNIQFSNKTNNLCSPLDAFQLSPTINWADNFTNSAHITREHALSQLKDFIQNKVTHYSSARDIPSENGTSQLSTWLHFGQIGIREVIQLLTQIPSSLAEDFLRQLYWRDFAQHLLFHFPHSQYNSLKPPYDLFPWQHNHDFLQKWRRGQTGYPIVDAGMRQLWQTGWMHNRVRMIVASFLVKHLLQDWRAGVAWFRDTLVDADLANNIMGWQWCAGSGADSSPYFRIFNPITQGEKFDPEGKYIKTYCPELKDLPVKLIHQPWLIPPLELLQAGVKLGENYPFPIVDHKQARVAALDAYQQFKKLAEANQT